ncbi:hypothetical protein OBBRIDRAFT_456067 [Obba rivulosa]|uniref:Uncharacterized protein n=1 Tax=Obba rivulosa TaxID=1052685 RepID=A0A8E2AXI1_9APHY|nr:hypothetical protein OBBRIDRAFT_456067 [Obba rivulosa]
MASGLGRDGSTTWKHRLTAWWSMWQDGDMDQIRKVNPGRHTVDVHERGGIYRRVEKRAFEELRRWKEHHSQVRNPGARSRNCSRAVISLALHCLSRV